MKKLFILAMLFASFTFSCTEKKSESGEHVHDDGTTHENHDEAVTGQEEFTTTDTVTTGAITSDSVHSHEGGEPHTN